MNVLVTGASGFLGAAVVREAAAAGHTVRAMIRSAARRDRVPLPDAQLVVADMRDVARFPDVVRGIQGVIHCAAVTSAGAPDEALSRLINVEGTRALLAAAAAAGVARWVQISSMSAHPGSTSVYGRTKLEADEVVRRAPAPVQWTILRPSLIYGPGGRGLVEKTVAILRKLPVVPVIGSGEETLRPVFVTDVARAAVICLTHERTPSRAYMLGGADEVTLNTFFATLAARLGVRRPLLHLPLPLCMALARVLGTFLKNPPLTVDNVLGVRQVQPVDIRPARADWGWDPIGLQEGLDRYFSAPNVTP